MFKHGNMGQGIYVDPKRDFCAMGFGTADNNVGVDYAPGYMRAAAKMLAGGDFHSTRNGDAPLRKVTSQ